MLLDMNDPKYLKRLLKILKFKADIYAPGVRVYAHEGLRVVGDRLMYDHMVLDPRQLFDGNGNQIVASREAR